MSTQTIATTTGRRSDLLTIAAAATGIVGVGVALVVAGAIALSPATIEVDATRALGQMDDYYFRHVPAPVVLTPMDDYFMRHRPAVLGPMDDYYFRHEPPQD